MPGFVLSGLNGLLGVCVVLIVTGCGSWVCYGRCSGVVCLGGTFCDAVKRGVGHSCGRDRNLLVLWTRGQLWQILQKKMVHIGNLGPFDVSLSCE